MRVRTIAKIVVLMLGGLLAPLSANAQTPGPTQYQLKAAFLYNFAKFTDWPADAFPNSKSPFIIGLLGDNPFGSDLERTVSGKTVVEHPMTIRTFSTAAEATNCHVLFINAAEKGSFPEIIKSLHGHPILTVSETESFIAAGGMINFLEEANKIRFQINDEAAKLARLKISSKLLGLAVRSPR